MRSLGIERMPEYAAMAFQARQLQRRDMVFLAGGSWIVDREA
jgi:hypothetical protein